MEILLIEFEDNNLNYSREFDVFVRFPRVIKGWRTIKNKGMVYWLSKKSKLIPLGTVVFLGKQTKIRTLGLEFLVKVLGQCMVAEQRSSV